MKRSARGAVALASSAVAVLAACTSGGGSGTAPSSTMRATSAASTPPSSSSPTVPATTSPTTGGIPPLLSANDVYAADRPNQLSAAVAADPAYVYVPNSNGNDVIVIDQRTMRIVRRFAGGNEPQHVVPSWDLRTLYVTADRPGAGSLTPIDPRTGRPGKQITTVDDAYNMYFTADGVYAIVVQEAYHRLAFFDPKTWRLHDYLDVPGCAGIDHMDFSASGTTALVSCEFANRMIVVDMVRHRLLRTVDLREVSGGMPQDVKLSPDGRTFFVADMMANGVYVIDASTYRVLRFQRTGSQAHGLYISRDSSRLFVTNRGEGSISVLDANTGQPLVKWRLPGGGSPDMGNISADGKVLWLSGRYDGVVYAIDASNGQLIKKIPVGAGPHGLTVWPLPGRYSLGHTGILR